MHWFSCLSEESVFCLFFTFSFLCKSVLSELLLGGVACLFTYHWNRDFFRCLSSLLIWDGSELIRSSEHERGACQLWPSRYCNLDGLFVGETSVPSYIDFFCFFRFFSLEMFRLPRKESFSLCQEEKFTGQHSGRLCRKMTGSRSIHHL